MSKPTAEQWKNMARFAYGLACADCPFNKNNEICELKPPPCFQAGMFAQAIYFSMKVAQKEAKPTESREEIRRVALEALTHPDFGDSIGNSLSVVASFLTNACVSFPKKFLHCWIDWLRDRAEMIDEAVKTLKEAK